jgi:hypothetical protein
MERHLTNGKTLDIWERPKHLVCKPNWRNWIARVTSNHKVAGSNPALGDTIVSKTGWPSGLRRCT